MLKDVQRRIPSIVALLRLGNNWSVNLLLVESGNAVVDRETLQNCYENKTQFLIAEANAKNKRLGLWQQSKVKSNSP